MTIDVSEEEAEQARIKEAMIKAIEEGRFADAVALALERQEVTARAFAKMFPPE